MRGIDVSQAQGRIDWPAVRASGVDFVMVRASQGGLRRDPSCGVFTDPRFEENVSGAYRAGMAVGVYHCLGARGIGGALSEAAYFLSVITPYRDRISLWAACAAEEERNLPRDRRTLTNTVHGFLRKTAAGGFTPMLYTSQEFLRERLGNVPQYPLGLAYWGTEEARALMYTPAIWQYGTAYTDGIAGYVPQAKGYFSLPTARR